MELRYRYLLVVFVFCVFLYGFFHLAKPATAYYYGCGSGPCNGSYPCNAPFSCNSGTCGISVNVCSGGTCVATGAWSQGAPYNCNDQCSPGNSVRSANFNACNVGCGNGTHTCVCGGENACPATCSGGVGCGASAACCVDQIPQTQPSGVTCTQTNDGGGVRIRQAQVNWLFNDTGSGCARSWGLDCTGNSNSFLLKFNGGKANEVAGAALRTLTTGLFPNWGTYTVQVCSENGYGENCSPAVNCVLTPPVCSVPTTNSSSVCRNTDPPLSATYGNNADQIQYYVDTTNPLSSPYTATSGWGTLATYTPGLGTGAYYWTAMSQSTAVPYACTTPNPLPTGMPINIDKTAPGVPAGSFTAFTPDANCLSNYFLEYDWNTVADTGCAGLAGAPYQAQISRNAAYTQIATDSGWISNTTVTTTNSYPGGTAFYAHARSRDSINNASVYSADATYTIPTPTLYPDIVIKGDFIEDVGYSSSLCTPGMSIDPARLDFRLNVFGTGVSSDCTTNATNYTCTIHLDNQGVSCVQPTDNISISGSTIYDGYEAIEWRTNNQCDQAPVNTITIDAAAPPPGLSPTPIIVNAFFKYGQQSWFKTSGISFNSRSTRNNTIPNNTTMFDTDDYITPPSNKYFIIKEGGAVLQGPGKAVNLGANATQGFSVNNWYSNSYDTSVNFTPAKFTDYMKSRKAYKTITSTADLTDGVYYFAGNGTLTLSGSGDFTGKKIVIVADQGTIDITNNITALSGGTLAVIANRITIQPTVTEVDAILIGNTVDIGPPPPPANTNSLKIVGNLIQLNASPAFANTRVSADGRKPALFIKLDQAGYMNLLEYLSVSVYDWKQVQ